MLALLLNACSIEKRQHLSGYHIDLKKREKLHQQTQADREERIAARRDAFKEMLPKRPPTLLASIHNGLEVIEMLQETRPVKDPERVQENEVVPDSIVCDRLTMRNGVSLR